jgi:predicted nucleotidyltransferase
MSAPAARLPDLPSAHEEGMLPTKRLVMSTTTAKPGSDDAIETLAKQLGRVWPNIEASAAATIVERDGIARVLTTESLVPADCSFVVFGSLARGEVTPKSDVDWTLLVDGQADPQHLAIALATKAGLADQNKKGPGPTAVFGGLTFSHELIHQIGGESDSNRNTTRRILLLLESREIGDGRVRERVMRGILRRYLEEDRGYHALHSWKTRVPRFLLNDIVRFWRTMAVDYAAKRRERDWAGWAIRNIKLRMSRKLIFAAGLAMCMSCELCPSPALTGSGQRDPAEFYSALQDFLIEFSNRTPLETLTSFALHFNAAATAGSLLDAYNEFLGILMDEDKRKRLESMEVDEAIEDSLFLEARSIGTAFQDGLTKLFFGTNPDLTNATQRYGVF